MPLKFNSSVKRCQCKFSDLTGNFRTFTLTTMKTMNLTQLAEYLGITTKTLSRMIDDGRFPVKPVDGFLQARWNVEDVDAWRLGK